LPRLLVRQWLSRHEVALGERYGDTRSLFRVAALAGGRRLECTASPVCPSRRFEARPRQTRRAGADTARSFRRAVTALCVFDLSLFEDPPSEVVSVGAFL
jgi:hypothetical protein